jgi:UDP-N-acetylmuramyl pentapeptide phosphotransferase/UDP-N-acetylglucosamine-1-phosphate transferase
MLFLFIIALNTFLYLFYSRLVKTINIYDVPDNKRKLHLGRVPIVGGVFCLINVLLIFSFAKFEYVEKEDRETLILYADCETNINNEYKSLFLINK